MSAVDGDWRPVFSLRQVKGTGLLEDAVEILVEPSERPTPELLLVVAVAYHNLDRFFRTIRTGGGDGGVA
jgi:hypothetical protein